MIAVPIISRIIELFKDVKEIHPKLTGVSYGMGHWSFNGKATGKYLDCEISEGEDNTATINGIDFSYYVLKDGRNYVATFTVTEGLKEIAELSNLLVDTKGLNYSTYIDVINETGVIFYREIEPKSIFGHEPLSMFMKSALYKEIIKQNVPHFIINQVI